VAGTLEEGGTRWGEVPKLSVAETDAIAERLRQVEASLGALGWIVKHRSSRSADDRLQRAGVRADHREKFTLEP